VNITGTAGFIDKGFFFGGSEFAARSATNGFVRALNYATTGGDANTVDVNTVTASRHVKLNAPASSFSGAGVTLLSLNLQGDNVNWTNTSGTLVAPGILKSGGGSSTISGGNVNAGSNAELVVRTDLATDNLTINSILNLGNTSGILTKSGAGTLILGGNNTYQGQTHVNAGTLSISANNNLGAEATGATLNLKGGTLQATGTFGLFNGTAGTNNRAVTLLDQSGIEVTGSNTLTIAGVISNNANAGVTRPGFNKTGTGTLVLTGTNTYTGATNVSNGTLIVNGSIATSSLTTVASGATIGGSGTVGALTVSSGGFINPGNSPGILTVSSNYVQAGTYNAEINGLTPGTLHDQISVTGAVDITGGSLTALFSGSYSANDLIFILLNDGTDAITGTYTGFAQGATVSNYGGFSWQISYTANNTGVGTGTFTGGNDIALIAVIPEPSVALLGALGALLLFRRRR
jgi:autotransporter-associated beta strand protein